MNLAQDLSRIALTDAGHLLEVEIFVPGLALTFIWMSHDATEDFVAMLLGFRP
jgi:hypothetical protein